MELRTYDESDLRPLETPVDNKGSKFLFLEDVASDNHDLFEGADNCDVAFRLQEAGVITQEDWDDPEHSVLYVYFKSRALGLAFIKRLNHYLQEKAIKLTEAKAF